jgi:hypothetical protein
MKAPWEFERAGNLPRAKKKKRHILYKLRDYPYNEATEKNGGLMIWMSIH